MGAEGCEAKRSRHTECACYVSARQKSIEVGARPAVSAATTARPPATATGTSAVAAATAEATAETACPARRAGLLQLVELLLLLIVEDGLQLALGIFPRLADRAEQLLQRFLDLLPVRLAVAAQVTHGFDAVLLLGLE